MVSFRFLREPLPLQHGSSGSGAGGLDGFCFAFCSFALVGGLLEIPADGDGHADELFTDFFHQLGELYVERDELLELFPREPLLGFQALVFAAVLALKALFLHFGVSFQLPG